MVRLDYIKDRELRLDKKGNQVATKKYENRFILRAFHNGDAIYMLNIIIATLNHYKMLSFPLRQMGVYLSKKHKHNKKCSKSRMSWERLLYYMLLMRWVRHDVINSANVMKVNTKFFEVFDLDYTKEEGKKFYPNDFEEMIKSE